MPFDDRRVSRERCAAAQKALAKWEQQGAIILNPFGEITELSYLYQFAFIPKRFDPVNDYFKPKSSKLFSLRGHAIEQLGVNANIEWRGDLSGKVEMGPNIRAYKAVGGLRRPDGTVGGWRDQIYEKDLDVLLEGHERRIRAKQGLNDEQIAYQVNQAMIEERRHISTKVETGAKLRVIRKLLGIPLVSEDQRSSTWVVVRIDMHPEFADPTLKQIAAMHAMGIQPQLYGPTQAAQLPEPIADADFQPADEKEDMDIPFDEGLPSNTLTEDEFNALVMDEKVKSCQQMMERVKYDAATLPYPVEDIPKNHNRPDEQLWRLYAMLIKRL